MIDPLEIVLATRNPGKVRELRALLSDFPVRLLTLDEAGGAPEVEEDRPTLEGNARKKALVIYRHTGRPALADDTGLEVAALDGAPGVYSARYAGPDVTEADNRTKLLHEMEGITDRRARFRTVAAFAANGVVHTVEGVCEGHIAEVERGAGGFGYDALFVPEGETRTFAELSAAEKDAVSHRGLALRKLAAYLQERLGQEWKNG